MYFKVKLADLVIGVEYKYETTRLFCRDYLSEDTPVDFEVKITDEDIRNERRISACEEQKKENQVICRNEYLETLALLRKISNHLPEYNCFLMHGAVVSVDDAGYMFVAPSGTGKSTHINLWKQYFDNIEIVNGDKPFVRVTKNAIRAYGTPWGGKEGWQKNTFVSLKGICLLNRGKENRIVQMPSFKALPSIIGQVHYTEDTQMAGKTLELLNQLLKEVHVYRLECDMSREAAECSYKGMVGER